MKNLARLLALFALTAFVLTGCTADAPADPGHDHGDHDHGHDHDDQGADDHSTDQKTELGTLEVALATLQVTLMGEVTPGKEVHFDVSLADGTAPETLRAWIGQESGAGSMKVKLEGKEGHWHGHVETPDDVAGAALWIEAEDDAGERTRASLPLQ